MLDERLKSRPLFERGDLVCREPAGKRVLPAAAPASVDEAKARKLIGVERARIEIKSDGVPPSARGRIGFEHPIKGPFAPIDRARWSTAVFPAGAHHDGRDATFAVRAKNAQMVLLEVYDQPHGTKPKYTYAMEKRGEYWQAKLGAMPEPVYYGYRFFGPNYRYTPAWTPGSAEGFKSHVDEFGNRFNPNKLVADPYARELSHDKETREMRAAGHDLGIYSTGDADYHGTPSYLVDTGRWAPKAVLFRDSTSFGKKPEIAENDAIIYEAHTRGLTQHPSSMRLKDLLAGVPGFEDVVNIPNELRGTYKGAALMAKYLKAMGFNTIELLPVHQFSDDTNVPDGPGNNFWGYMTDGYFAPHRRFAFDNSPGGPTREFKEMVKAFHDEGIEVYLDVVFNHTGEGGHNKKDPNDVTLSGLRGVDNASYFALAQDKRHDWVSTGCGNNLDGSKPAAHQLIMDSLRYWCDEMGVDGFRFDLATVLGRVESEGYAFNQNAPLLKEIREFARSRNIEVIAEAWDADASGYQVGNFPAGWGEWNGKYRDWVRRFVKSDGNIGEFLEAFAGTPSLYGRHGGPGKSVNFITAHDGFTMADLVSYNGKQNGALSGPFGPVNGGGDDNDSWDSVIGDQQATQELRRQQLKNLWTLHMFARGVPMIVYGDELGRTQNGNNDPYKLDTVATHNNYAMIASDAPQRVPTEGGGAYHDNLGAEESRDQKNGLFLFSAFMTQLPQEPPGAAAEPYDEVPIEYRSARGGPHQAGENHTAAIHIDGSKVGDDRFLLLVNAYWEDVDFQVPEAAPGKKWVRIADTSNRFEDRNNVWQPEAADPVPVGGYRADQRSVAVLQEINM